MSKMEINSDLDSVGSEKSLENSCVTSHNSFHHVLCENQTNKKSQSATEQSRNENRRGRPKTAVIGDLMIEGSNSVSDIKCKYCFRVFPREKSLQAHLRTHTGKLR